MYLYECINGGVCPKQTPMKDAFWPKPGVRHRPLWS